MADQRFFQKSGPFPLRELAQICEAEIVWGEGAEFSVEGLMIDDVRPLGLAASQDLACYHNVKYKDDLQKTQAAACLIQKENIHQSPAHLTKLVTDRPYRAYAKLMAHFYPDHAGMNKEERIAPTAIIAPSSVVGKNCIISDYVVIEDGVEIGDGSMIGAHTVLEKGVVVGKGCCVGSHVTISHTIMGDRVTIKSGARIGQKGFGFDMDDRGHVTVPQLGRVLVGDDVEIGSNTTIDRGSNGDTQIGRGCRIDNLVQIAHNVVLGDHCVLVAQVGIAGSTRLGKFVIAAGQVGIAGHLSIGDQVKIGAKSGIMRDVDAGQSMAGIPAVPVREHFRQVSHLLKIGQKK